MNMRVKIIDSDGKSLYQAYTELDQSVRLDIDTLPADQELKLKYEFFERNMVHKVDTQGDQHEGSGEEIKCNIPHFTQELVMISKKIIKNRIDTYSRQDIDKQSQIDLCLSRLDDLTPNDLPLD